MPAEKSGKKVHQAGEVQIVSKIHVCEISKSYPVK